MLLVATYNLLKSEYKLVFIMFFKKYFKSMLLNLKSSKNEYGNYHYWFAINPFGNLSQRQKTKWLKTCLFSNLGK